MTTENTTDPLTANLSTTGGSGEDLLSTLVGEGKKFKTVDDLARGKVAADEFVQKLEGENQALRALLRNNDDSNRSNELMQELLNRVSRGTLVEKPEAQPASIPSASGQGNQSPAMTSRDVELLFKKMRQQEQEDRSEAEAMTRISSKYGDKTDEFLQRKATELNLDVGILKATARRSPTAFYNLVGENTSNNQNNRVSGNALPRGSTNSAAIIENAGDSGVRNKRYYDKLRAEKGARAFVLDRSLQVQMHKDMMALGNQWEGGTA